MTRQVRVGLRSQVATPATIPHTHSTRARRNPEISFPAPRHRGLARYISPRLSRRTLATLRPSRLSSHSQSVRPARHPQSGPIIQTFGPSAAVLRQAQVLRIQDRSRAFFRQRTTEPTTALVAMGQAPTAHFRPAGRVSTRGQRALSW